MDILIKGRIIFGLFRQTLSECYVNIDSFNCSTILWIGLYHDD